MCSDEILAAVRAQLESFPDDRRQLAPAPELANLPRRWLPGRKFKTLAREPIPMAIRPASSLEWKSSAYRLQRAGAPDTEYTGVDFLVAYWRYLEVLEARARLE